MVSCCGLRNGPRIFKLIAKLRKQKQMQGQHIIELVL